MLPFAVGGSLSQQQDDRGGGTGQSQSSFAWMVSPMQSSTNAANEMQRARSPAQAIATPIAPQSPRSKTSMLVGGEDCHHCGGSNGRVASSVLVRPGSPLVTGGSMCLSPRAMTPARALSPSELALNSPSIGSRTPHHRERLLLPNAVQRILATLPQSTPCAPASDMHSPTENINLGTDTCQATLGSQPTCAAPQYSCAGTKSPEQSPSSTTRSWASLDRNIEFVTPVQSRCVHEKAHSVKASTEESASLESSALPETTSDNNSFDKKALLQLLHRIEEQQERQHEMISRLTRQWEQRFKILEQAVNRGLEVAGTTAAAMSERAFKVLQLGEVLEGSADRAVAVAAELGTLARRVGNLENELGKLGSELSAQGKLQIKPVSELVTHADKQMQQTSWDLSDTKPPTIDENEEMEYLCRLGEQVNSACRGDQFVSSEVMAAWHKDRSHGNGTNGSNSSVAVGTLKPAMDMPSSSPVEAPFGTGSLNSQRGAGSLISTGPRMTFETSDASSPKGRRVRQPAQAASRSSSEDQSRLGRQAFGH